MGSDHLQSCPLLAASEKTHGTWWNVSTPPHHVPANLLAPLSRLTASWVQIGFPADSACTHATTSGGAWESHQIINNGVNLLYSVARTITHLFRRRVSTEHVFTYFPWSSSDIGIDPKRHVNRA